jgi:hypothetical protein
MDERLSFSGTALEFPNLNDWDSTIVPACWTCDGVCLQCNGSCHVCDGSCRQCQSGGK